MDADAVRQFDVVRLIEVITDVNRKPIYNGVSYGLLTTIGQTNPAVTGQRIDAGNQPAGLALP